MHRIWIAGWAVAIGWVLGATNARADDDALRATIRDVVAKLGKEKEAKGEEKGDDGTLTAKWKDGLRIEGRNVKLKIGGRIQLDHWLIDDDEFEAAPFHTSITPGTYVDVRRARLYTEGELYKHTEFKLQIDFETPSSPKLNDVYIGLVNLRDCLGCGAPSLRVGHFMVPFGLEQLTSTKYTTFLERSATVEAFAPARRYQVQLHDRFRGDQVGYQLGGFLWEQEESFESDGGAELSDGWGVAARVTWAPWWDYACACKRLHLGASAILADDLDNRRPPGADQRTRFRTRGGYGQFERLIDTGPLDIDKLFMTGFELAWVYGPWSVQGEYMVNQVTRKGAAGDATFSGWYAQASYWVTGECRNYKEGTFHRTKPCCNFLDKDCCCLGGLELAARYSVTDLQDGGVNGGELAVLTLGANWHFNTNARVQLNFLKADVDGGPRLGGLIANSASLTGLGVRWSVDF